VVILTVVVAAALAASAIGRGAGAATAADECRGLQVCLPVAGPWVVVPAPGPTATARADWELRCPFREYVVAGTDARLSDPDLDVFIRGETGSPVSPGVTTSRAVLFSGVYAGRRRIPTTFRPFVGCIPASGGGGRSLTSASALPPTRPVTRRVAQRRVPPAATVTASVACRPSETVVAGGHAVAFRTASPPTRRVIAAVRARRSTTPRRVTVTAAAARLPRGAIALVQVVAYCRRDVR
jgi:hypothetical protein